jgi:hypothetical protein
MASDKIAERIPGGQYQATAPEKDLFPPASKASSGVSSRKAAARDVAPSGKKSKLKFL